MLSILIPTYNYDITSLTKELQTQCNKNQIIFEILAYDDGSKSPLNQINQTVNSLKYCTFKALSNNLGRSAIRNLLGKDAQYENLLFIDAGTFPKTQNFIKKYLSIDNEKIISGGMTYLEIPPKSPYRLRWLYTKKREIKALCSSNFMIKKEVFISNPFDESLKKYGYEDVLFFDAISEKKITVVSFDNPVIHNADDDAVTFIKKTEYAIKNLHHIIKNNKIKKERLKISKTHQTLEKLRLLKITALTFKLIRPLLLLNLKSSAPLIFLFDFYKLGYFCSLNNKI